MPTVNGHRLPISSEEGAQIKGPEAKPRTKSVVPRIPTSELTPNALATPPVPGAKIALANDATKVPKQTMTEMYSLNGKGKVSEDRAIGAIGILNRKTPIVRMFWIVRAVKRDDIIF
jgi:hypothetical protein